MVNALPIFVRAFTAQFIRIISHVPCPIFYILSYDNSYSTPGPHAVSFVYYTILIKENELYYKTFSHICSQHPNSPAHYTPILYSSVYFPFLFICLDQLFHFYMMD